jgi:cell shape-determining protein MreD
MITALGIILQGLAVLIQTTIASHIKLLHGTADLALLMLVALALQERFKPIWVLAAITGLLMGLISAIPIWLMVLCYLGVTAFTQLLQLRLWQIPILALITTVIFGTILIHQVSYGYLWINGTPLNWVEGFNYITLPSILINVLLAIPVFGMIGELIKTVSPEKSEQ